MKSLNNNIFDEMETSNKYFVEDDYKIDFRYSKKMYPLLGKSNLELIKIINSLITNNESKDKIENVKMTLFISNLKLINYTIRTYFEDFEFEKDELRNIGIEGLYNAINTFKYNVYNSNFSRYAVIAIRNAIRSNFKDTFNITYYSYNKILEFYKKKRELDQINFGKTTIDELVQATNINEEDINNLLRRKIDICNYKEHGIYSSNYEVLTILEENYQNEILERILSLFDEIKKDVFLNSCNYFCNSLSRVELAEKHNISPKTVDKYLLNTRVIIKYYYEHRNEFIHGNEYLYDLLLSMLDIYKLKLKIESNNQLFIKKLYYIEDIDKVIDIFNVLVDLLSHHKSRDAEYLTLECFKNYNLLLDIGFMDSFMNKYNEKLQAKIKKKNKLG